MIVWIVGGLAAVALMAWGRTSRARRDNQHYSLGSVSEQWIAEHRANRTADLR